MIIIMLIERRENTIFTSSFEQTYIRFNQGCFAPNLVEIRPVVLENFFYFVNVVLLSGNYIPVGPFI